MRARDLAAHLAALGALAALVLPTADPGLLWPGAAGSALAAALLGSRARHGTFALRLALALPLLAGGVLLLAGGRVLPGALGAAWLAGGAALALGFLAPWAGLYAALGFALAPAIGGGAGWFGLTLAALGLALTEDDTLALDARLARRGGLFPVVRREVVLDPLGPR